MFLQFQPLQISDMKIIFKDMTAILTTPTTALAGKKTNWSQCHVSASTFFENKTGYSISKFRVNVHNLLKHHCLNCNFLFLKQKMYIMLIVF